MSPTVGLHLNFRGNVTVLSARKPDPLLRETLIGSTRPLCAAGPLACKAFSHVNTAYPLKSLIAVPDTQWLTVVASCSMQRLHHTELFHWVFSLARRRAVQIGKPGLIALAVIGVGRGQAQVESAALPFFVGEKLNYEIRIASGSKVGTARMWIEGPVDVRGTSTYVLRFDSRIRIAFLPAISRSSSWFDPLREASLRFFKHERNPLTRDDELVDLYPDERQWKSANGEAGQSPTDAPLDELSFMYFIRTLPMTPGATYRFDRHFDLSRNPITVSVIRREVIPTPIGELHVLRVEMRVRDPRHYKGEGLIRIHLTDDECRLPARIESTMPVIGTAILTVVSENSPCKRPLFNAEEVAGKESPSAQ